MKKYAITGLSLLLFCGLVFVDHRTTWDWIYTHWLYDYHFGFMKRGLIGESVSTVLGHPTVVALKWVKLLSWTVFAMNVGFLLYFFYELQKKITEPEARKRFQGLFLYFLLVPVSLRNFAYDLGCLDQISFLLLYLQWFNPAVWVTALGSVLLTLTHENYLFLILPALSLIVYLKRGLIAMLGVVSVTAATAGIVFVFGHPSANMNMVWDYIVSKADSHVDHNIPMLYWGLSNQLAVNRMIFQSHLPYLLGYVAYALFWIPVGRLYFKLAPPIKIARLIEWSILAGFVAMMVLGEGCRVIHQFFIVTGFLTLYFIHEGFNPGAWTERAAAWFGRKKWLYAVVLASLVIPAVGVDIPRVYQWMEIMKAKLN